MCGRLCGPHFGSMRKTIHTTTCCTFQQHVNQAEHRTFQQHVRCICGPHFGSIRKTMSYNYLVHISAACEPGRASHISAAYAGDFVVRISAACERPCHTTTWCSFQQHVNQAGHRIFQQHMREIMWSAFRQHAKDHSYNYLVHISAACEPGRVSHISAAYAGDYVVAFRQHAKDHIIQLPGTHISSMGTRLSIAHPRIMYGEATLPFRDTRIHFQSYTIFGLFRGLGEPDNLLLLLLTCHVPVSPYPVSAANTISRLHWCHSSLIMFAVFTFRLSPPSPASRCRLLTISLTAVPPLRPLPDPDVSPSPVLCPSFAHYSGVCLPPEPAGTVPPSSQSPQRTHCVSFLPITYLGFLTVNRFPYY